MLTYLLSTALWVLLVLPFILLPKKKNKCFREYVLLFILYVFLNQVLLKLPVQVVELKFIPGAWNWSGKVLAIVGSLLFIALYKGLSTKEVGLTLRQRNVPKFALGVTFGAIVLGTVWGGLNSSARDWSAETLAFQLLMPSIDEEIAYRGIMLVLLNKALCHTNIVKGISVANLVTSLLFAFCHALFITSDFGITFQGMYFIQSFALGLALAYIAEKTGSLLFPMLAHSTSNVLISVFKMIK
jgi:uncharacterized protein